MTEDAEAGDYFDDWIEKFAQEGGPQPSAFGDDWLEEYQVGNAICVRCYRSWPDTGSFQDADIAMCQHAGAAIPSECGRFPRGRPRRVPLLREQPLHGGSGSTRPRARAVSLGRHASSLPMPLSLGLSAPALSKSQRLIPCRLPTLTRVYYPRQRSRWKPLSGATRRAWRHGGFLALYMQRMMTTSRYKSHLFGNNGQCII